MYQANGEEVRAPNSGAAGFSRLRHPESSGGAEADEAGYHKDGVASRADAKSQRVAGRDGEGGWGKKVQALQAKLTNVLGTCPWRG